MALARVVRIGLRRSRSAFCRSVLNKGLLFEGAYSHQYFNFSYISSIKKQNYMNFSVRGIAATPHCQFPSANPQMAMEESESEHEEPKYAVLEATKPCEKPRVVVLGTGWAACRFLKGLDTKTYDVVCISPRNHMVFTPLLASTCVGTLEFRSVAEHVSRIQDSLAKNPDSYFFLASCFGIDTDKHEVYCQAVYNGKVPEEPDQYKVAYEKLVIASGAEPLTFGIKGVKEHAFFLREVYHAQEIRKQLLHNLMISESPGKSEKEKKRLLHCVVVGGGPTGVEFSGELSDFIMNDVNERYPHVKHYIKVTLIEANEILSSFDASLREYAKKHLTKALVECHRIGVDQWLRVPSVEDVFALGDCAGFLEQSGRPVLPALAQPQEGEEETIAAIRERQKWENDDYIYTGHILNDKLPSSWKDFKKNLKHKKEDISLEQLGNHLRLEEEYRKQDVEKETNVQEKVHMVEEGQSNRTSKKRGKDKDKSQAHDEIHLVDNDESWWVDSGATRHVCKNKNFFKTLEEGDGDVLYMGNSSSVQVKGKGTVEIEFTSGKILRIYFWKNS
ncbi:internal alternative NAD(P)H-ubiquinone oxidoreductase A1, mitochondrial-like [Senna tora]|uniref:Internal alternative NAD(P)H-ubiquinone oxidoreductase A1, mitochondrial-like n=1 Tax=Senna tora TaxID=362788 RepID=A0A834X9A1_9FABA|nr:internal alternative NAD(P)H-ubiquinone oxidoreductase A1, mitochondrial-like [Senna tora]